MAPVKKQKAIKSPKKDKKVKEGTETADPVISGQLQKKINKSHLKPKKDPRGVVFIKHLPHGFFEEQLKNYFEQFGNVTRVRLARSRRTGNSKGFAFVEFEYPEVAEVAAETMNNYLMFKKVVKAAYIPPEKQQFNYFRTNVKQIINKSGKKVWVSGKTASIQQKANQHNDWTEDKFQARITKQMKKIKKMGEKFAHLGIDINKFVIPPKIVTEEQKAQNKLKDKKDKEEMTAGTSKTLKRKSENEKKAPPSKKESKKKSKEDVALEDLLGNTIQDDSDDDDYIATTDSDEEVNEESSDEETYGFTKDSDSQDEDDSRDDGESEEDDNETHVPLVSLKKTKKTSFGKSLKTSNSERFDQMVKRKPHTGAIKKFNKKSSQKPLVAAKNKDVLQLTAAKELAKPLPTLKGTLGKTKTHSKATKKAKK